jgi:cell division protein FtsI/penicillin-binding protein 2
LSNLRAHWQEQLQPLIGELCIEDADGKLIVDTLNPYYLGDITQIHGGIEQQFNAYRLRIQQQQNEFAEGTSPRQKWDWAAGFFDRAIGKHGISVAPIQHA